MGRKTKLKILKQEARKQELKQIQAQKFDSKNILLNKILFIFTLLSVLLAILSLALVVFKPGLPSGHDLISHAFRSKIFIEALKTGQFPVRWVDWSNNNFSGPFFNFYQVGYYYLIYFINLISFSIYDSIKILIVGSWWLGALFMFLYTRRFGTLPASLSALIYAFTPYTISDFFVRASYPECLAISFCIGVLWATDRILVTAKTYYGIPLALCVAGLILTHLPTVVIMVPVLIGYFFLLLFNKEIKLKGFLPFLVAGLLGLGLSAFYLLPSLFELNLVKSSLLTSSYYDFHPHFVYLQQLFSTFWDYGISTAGPLDGMSFQVGIIQWIIIFLALTLTIYYLLYKKNQKNTSHLIFWLLTCLYSFFFIHEASLSFWENIQTIAFIQYPWRYLMIIPVASAILGSLLLQVFTKTWQQSLVIFLALFGVFIFYKPYLKPATFLPTDYFKFETSDWQKSEAAKYAILEEGYEPKTAELIPQGNVKKWTIDTEQAQIEEKAFLNHYKDFITKSSEPVIFTLNTHYFPGWKAYIDNMETPIETTQYFSFMRISVPIGLHRVEFKFTNTPVRSAGNAISTLSLMFMIIYTGVLLWKLKKEPD
ncbi:MAG: hypothetical protein PHQ59_00090 [Candidatus Daviesbacteria bacterium]|nr:hypothetical protein [Candidatus Daviesbacteria bacterium]